MRGTTGPFFMRDVEIRYNQIIILVHELTMEKPSGWREVKKSLLSEGKHILDNEDPAGFHTLPSIEERRVWLKTLVEERDLEDLLEETLHDSGDLLCEEDFLLEDMFHEY